MFVKFAFLSKINDSKRLIYSAFKLFNDFSFLNCSVPSGHDYPYLNLLIAIILYFYMDIN